MSLAKLVRPAFALAALTVGALGCVNVNLLAGGGPGALSQQVVYGQHGPKILMLTIDGMITTEGSEGFFGMKEESTVARVHDILDAARRDGGFAALLLRIDSPGGSATASDQIYTDIMNFKRDTGVPVYAQMLSTAASGGYYVAMAADVVQAHPTTVTGSIGVIFVSLNFAGLMEKWGIEDQTLTAGAQKDAGSMLRRMTPEERAHFQSVIDELHGLFKRVVKAGRPKLSAEQIDALADGRIYSAKQALDAGLIDRIGTLEETVRALEEKLGVAEAQVVVMRRPREWKSNIYTRGPEPPRLAALGGGDAGVLEGDGGVSALLQRVFGRPGFHYLWWPGLQP